MTNKVAESAKESTAGERERRRCGCRRRERGGGKGAVAMLSIGGREECIWTGHELWRGIVPLEMPTRGTAERDGRKRVNERSRATVGNLRLFPPAFPAPR